MIEIVIVILTLLGLAKHGRGGRRGYTLRKVRLTPELGLGTLASDTALVVVAHPVTVSSLRAISMVATWSLSALTAGEGPITVGYAHSDYTVTEIKECLETGNINPNLKIEAERANRLVRVVGTFSAAGNAVLNDGKPIKTRLNWGLGINRAVNIFAFNESTVALTTGAQLRVAGAMWVKDSV